MSNQNENEINQARIETIGRLAEQVAEQDAELEGAIDAERKAEADLLRLVCERVRPAISALSSRVQTAMAEDRDGTPSYATWRGLYINIHGERVGPYRSSQHDASGIYTGTDLFLCPDSSDGTGFQFRELHYSGRWSRYENALIYWLAQERVLTIAEVVAEYDIPDVITCVEASLRMYAAGNATKRAEQARNAADKLTAVCALLGK